MDVRFVVPSLLMTVTVLLTGAVDAALRPDEGFTLSPRQGSLALVSLSGPLGVSPSLVWGEPPAGTESFMLVAEDLDAPEGQRVLWAVWGLSAGARSIDGALPREASPVSDLRQSLAPDGRYGYAAPTVSATLKHRLRFTVLALDEPLALPRGTTGDEAILAASARLRGAAHWHAGGGWAR